MTQPSARVKRIMGRRAQKSVVLASFQRVMTHWPNDHWPRKAGMKSLLAITRGAVVVGVGAVDGEGQAGEGFAEGRMFGVEAEVKLPDVAEAGADVGYFVEGRGFAAGGAE